MSAQSLDGCGKSCWDEGLELHFFQGWGLSPAESLAPLAQALREALGAVSVHFVDFGFWRHQPAIPFQRRSGSGLRVGVGHSFGFLWMLNNAPCDFDAVISVAGFTRFSQCADFRAGVPARVIKRMRDKLGVDPNAVVAEFRRMSGFEGALPGEPDLARLDQGLRCLEDWDGREAFARLECPCLALAARDDQVVSSAVAESCFSSVVWAPAGGHTLPVSQTEWCAKVITQFLREESLAE